MSLNDVSFDITFKGAILAFTDYEGSFISSRYKSGSLDIRLIVGSFRFIKVTGSSGLQLVRLFWNTFLESKGLIMNKLNESK